MIDYEITVSEVVVDDFTGQDIKDGGWALTRLTDGETCHFQGLAEGSIDALASLIGIESAARSFVSILESRLEAELAEQEADQSSALMLAQQADEIADEDSAALIERIAEYTLSPGDEQQPLKIGTPVVIESNAPSARRINGMNGSILDYCSGQFDYLVQLEDGSISVVFESEVSPL